MSTVYILSFKWKEEIVVNRLEQLDVLKDELDECRQILNAIGNKTRLGIISTLFEINCKGMRVGEIANYAKLSRPAVSHHLKVLIDAEVVGRHQKGTRNYYYMKLGGSWQRFVELVNQVEKLRIEELEDLKMKNNGKI